MKILSLYSVLVILSTTAIANDDLSSGEKSEIEHLLAESASKLLYLERDCEMPMDRDKFKELAKIKAFSEGFITIEGIDWSHVKQEAHEGYSVLKTEAPLGELCEQYKADIKGKYQFLKAN